MKLGSLFDGSGGFPLAGSLCGIEPVWASEVEPFPVAVTRSRFPSMKHLGSVTDVKGNEVEPVDVITFGSPCQDLSVAGKRAGLKHTNNGDEETTRSGLFMEAIRIIKEMREATNGLYPRFAVWENVPGAFSSNKGEDFRIVLEEFVKVCEPSAVMPAVPKNGWPYADSYCGDGWSLAYRVFDAQFWGVPQRRRRIYLVADFRGQRAGEVSFEREGVRGYFETGRTPWEAVAGDAESGARTADCTGECVTPVAYSFDSLASNSMKSSNPHSGCRQVEVSKCLDTTDPNPSKNQGGIAIVEPVPYTLKLRSGCEGGGKGALVQEDKSATLATNNDQYLFQPMSIREENWAEDKVKNAVRAGESKSSHAVVTAIVDKNILDDQGGSQISVRTDGKVPTLRAEMHGNVPCVMEAAGFCTEHSAKARGVGFQKECAPTLRAGVTPALVYSVENHPADSRVSIDESGKVQTLTSRMGTGGGNVPMVMEPIAISSKQQSLVTSENVANTLGANDYKEPQAVCQPVTCVGVLASSAVNAETTDGTISPCLMARAGTGGNQLPLVALEAPIPIHDQATRFSGKRGDKADGKGNGLGVGNPGDPMNTLTSGDRHAVAFAMQGFGDYKESDVASGLKARDYKDATDLVAETPIALDRAFYNQGQNAQYDPQFYTDGTVPTLVAKGPGAVAVRYIVRRLTPTECARLQGFPDNWGHPDIKESLSDEEYAFWLNVRNTHATINGKATKEYTKDQILKWYNGLHTDSAEYKLWGNGIALPCALYIMQGIADAFKED